MAVFPTRRPADPPTRRPADLDNILVITKLLIVTETAALTAMASPRRREILRLVWRDERAAGEIHAAMPDVTFGAVSLQLRALVDAGLVDVRSEGRNRFYRARREAFGPVGRMLERMWADALWRLKHQAELEQSRRGPLPGSRRRKP
jgi:DNA-binding transcriptional ArsR family regulator